MMCCRLSLLYLVIFLVACKNHTHPDKKIFRYNEVTGIASLDPAFAKNQSIMWPVHQLYNTLVAVDDKLNIVPSLASRWEFSADKKQITFYLRDSIFFHDDPCFKNGIGRKLRAQDVVYSFSRLTDAATASPGAWIFNQSADSIYPFNAVNDSVFVLKLQKPFHPILGILSMQYCSIVAQEAVEMYGNDFRRHPVGTGPFRFVAWDEGQALILKKNEHYWEKDADGRPLPYLDGIKVNFFDSRATEFLEFTQGRLDFINDLDASFKDEVLTKQGQLKKQWTDKINLQKSPYLNIEYLGILMDTGSAMTKGSSLGSKKIRQAINYGIDKRKMIFYLRNSVGYPAESGFVPMGLPSFDSNVVKGYYYNPSLARQLLIQGGYSPGSPAIKLLTIPNYANLGTFIANELKQIGLNIQVEVVQKSLLLEQTSKSQAAFFRGSWIADYPDAENYLSVFYSKNPAPPNYTRFKNAAYDALYESAFAETNDSLRYLLYHEMDKIIIEEAPVVPLWYDMVLRLVQKNVSGFDPNSQNILELTRVNKD